MLNRPHIHLIAALLLATGFTLQAGTKATIPELSQELESKRRSGGLAVVWIYGKDFYVKYFDGRNTSGKFPPEFVTAYFYNKGHSPNGRFVAGTTRDDRIVVLDLVANSFWTISDIIARKVVLGPNGKSIAAEGKRRSGEREGLIVVLDKGKEIIPVAQQGRHPSWSEDGSRLVYEEEGRLFVIDVRSRDLQSLGPGHDPSWSPDGKLILYRQSEDSFSLMDPSGGPSKPLFRGKNPSWSPDGNWISYRAADKDYRVVNTGGETVRLRLKDKPLTDLTWSPDSAYVMFVAAGPAGRSTWQCLEATKIIIHRVRDGKSMQLPAGCKSFPYQFYGWAISKRFSD